MVYHVKEVGSPLYTTSTATIHIDIQFHYTFNHLWQTKICLKKKYIVLAEVSALGKYFSKVVI